MFLRQLILETISESKESELKEETLKWGEPSYLTTNGSTIRINWKKSNPEEYAMFFNCKTNLVDTFKELYHGELAFEGNRAIVFDINAEIPVKVLKHCIFLSINYHQIKHLPLLGE